MVRGLTAVLCLVLVFVPAPSSAAAQCNVHSKMLAGLKKQFGETVIGLGVGKDGSLVELLASENGETWSVLVLGSTGISCLVASGENWRGGTIPSLEEPES